MWKSTEDKLHKIWNSKYFSQISAKRAHPWDCNEIRNLIYRVGVYDFIPNLFCSNQSPDRSLIHSAWSVICNYTTGLVGLDSINREEDLCYPGVCSFCWNLTQIFWVSYFVVFVLGRFSHFNIANSKFCGAWTPSFCEFTCNFGKTSTPLRRIQPQR